MDAAMPSTTTPPPPHKRLTRTPERYHPYSREVSLCAGGDREGVAVGIPRSSSQTADHQDTDISLSNTPPMGPPTGGAITINLEVNEEVDNGSSSHLGSSSGRRANARQAPSFSAPVGTELAIRPVQTRAVTKPARDAAKLKAEIGALKARIQGLERSEKRLRGQMALRGELLRDARTERDEARTECVKAEEVEEEKENMLESVRREANRYRGWWLTDYYSLKVALGLVPDKKDVEAIAAASHKRFMAYSAALKKQ